MLIIVVLLANVLKVIMQIQMKILLKWESLMVTNNTVLNVAEMMFLTNMRNVMAYMS